MSAFTPAGSGGIPLSTRVSGVTSPTIVNVLLLLASTEYSYILPAGTRRCLLKLRSRGVGLQLAYTLGDSALIYITIPPGCSWSEDDLDLDAMVTLYFQTPSASQTLEIVSWV